MKKIKENKKLIIGFIIGGILFGSIGVCATTIAASSITYDNSSSGLSATNTQEAIDEIFLNDPSKYYIYHNGTRQVTTLREEEAKSTNDKYIKYDNGDWYLCLYNNKWVCKKNDYVKYSDFGCYGGSGGGPINSSDGTQLGAWTYVSACSSNSIAFHIDSYSVAKNPGFTLRCNRPVNNENGFNNGISCCIGSYHFCVKGYVEPSTRDGYIGYQVTSFF